MARSKLNFTGPSYQYNSLSFDSQRSVNLYPVQSEVQDSKAQTALIGTPGLSIFCQLPTSPLRGLYQAMGYCFAVAGNTLYQVMQDGTYIALGILDSFYGFVSISDNGQQLCIVDGQSGYIYTQAGVFSQITSDGFYGADTVTFIDSYFIFNKPNTPIYYISGFDDGTTESALDFAEAEAEADNIVGLIQYRNDLWVFKQNDIQVMYDSGDNDFPFEPIKGVLIEYGCAAAGSIVATANTLIWLGNDNRGNGVVWMAQGYQPQRVSTAATEYAFQQYGDLSKTVAYSYQEGGHYFYVLNILGAPTTWVYDITMQMWHERCYFENGVYERHRGQCHAFAFDQHLVGDYANGNIYTQSLNLYDDAGQPKRWERTMPHISDTLEYIRYKSIQLDMQTGQGSAPVMLQWSDDGGYSWSNEHWRDAGLIGERLTRVIWRQLGRSRDRVFKMASIMPYKTFLIQAIVETV